MNRKEIEESYEVKDGIINSSGKFEMEPIYVLYFWDFYMNGFQDDEDSFDGVSYSGYVVTDEDRKQFLELKDIYGIILWESDQGFVHSRVFEKKEEYEDFFIFEEVV